MGGLGIESKDISDKLDVWINSCSNEKISSLVSTFDNYRSLWKGLPFVANTHMPLRPLILENGFYKNTYEITQKITKLIDRILRYEISKDDFDPVTLGFDPAISKLIPKNDQLFDLALEISRPDFIVENGIIKVIELNIDSSIGGIIDGHLMPEMYFRSELGIFLRNQKNVYANSPLLSIVDIINRQAKKISISHPRVGIYEFEFDIEVLEAFGALLASYGISAFRVDSDKYRSEESHIIVDGKSPDILLRLLPFECLELPGDLDIIELFKNWTLEKGQCYLSNNYCSLISAKMLFASLFTHSSLFTPDENAFIRNHVPYTLSVDDITTPDNDGHPTNVLDILHREKNKWILKSSVSHGGKKVILGASATVDEWNDALTLARKEKYWIAQHTIVPDRFELPFYIDGKIEKIALLPVFGSYNIGGSPSGLMIRYNFESTINVINHARGANLCFCFIDGEGN